jgi:hypothetical protein
MGPLEKCARDICWAGFASPKDVGRTKAAYWRELPDETRYKYMREAQYIAWLITKVPVDTVNALHMIGERDRTKVRKPCNEPEDQSE